MRKHRIVRTDSIVMAKGVLARARAANRERHGADRLSARLRAELVADDGSIVLEACCSVLAFDGHLMGSWPIGLEVRHVAT